MNWVVKYAECVCTPDKCMTSEYPQDLMQCVEEYDEFSLVYGFSAVHQEVELQTLKY
jgi:hypothetical protein